MDKRNGELTLKNVELRLVCELMKNSHKSDRELAKAVGVSQPTISRIKNRLEKEGVIKEYTMIPDFRKLGFEIMAFILVKFTRELTEEMIDTIERQAKELEKKTPTSTVLIMRGRGLGYNGVVASFHEDYASFLRLFDMAKQLPFVDVSDVESFLINLREEKQYRLLTLSGLADYLLKPKEE